MQSARCHKADPARPIPGGRGAAAGPPSAVRAVPLRVLYVSKGDPACDAVADAYAAKVARYTAFEQQRLRPNPRGASASDAAAQRRDEGDLLLRALDAGAARRPRLVLCDERGAALDSLRFAALLSDASQDGADALCFCIGGPFGVSDAVRQRAHTAVSLSPLVLNHQVARIVLLEALYRSWTILRGEGYHHV